MSQFFDRVDQIRGVIQGAFPSEDVKVISNRRNDIRSEFDKAIGRVRGAVVIVSWEGISGIDEKKNPRGTSNFAIGVVAKPTIRDKSGKPQSDEIVQEIIKAIHRWNPVSQECGVKDNYLDLYVDSVIPEPDENFDVYTITATQTLQLT